MSFFFRTVKQLIVLKCLCYSLLLLTILPFFSKYYIFFKSNQILIFTIEKKFDSNLNMIYVKLYDITKIISAPLVFILACFIYIYFIDINITYIYISKLLFLFSIFIKLVMFNKYWINNNFIKNNFPLFHLVIKYILFSLLLLNLYLLICIIYKLFSLSLSIINSLILKSNIISKIKDKFNNIKSYFSKNPRDPKNPDILILSNEDKKKNKKKAMELKEILLQKQKENLNFNFNRKNLNNTFNSKRDWKETINIEEVPDFSIDNQLKNLNKEYILYDKQVNKFKRIVKNIDKGKENFYPNESKTLFNQYIHMIELLKTNLKSLEKNLKKNKSNKE